MFLLQKSFVKLLEDSSIDAFLFGPKVLIFSFLSLSTIPFTRGSSGPTTTKLIFSFFINFFIELKLLILIFIHSASELIPAFPGIQKSFSHKGDLDIAQHNACSLPPDPKTKTLNWIFLY